MLIRVRLSDVDRQRYDCPAELPVDPHSMSWRETVALQKGVEVDAVGAPVLIAYDSPAAWRNELGRKEGPTMAAIGVLVWLGLHRAGVTVSLADLDFDHEGLDYEVEQDPVDVGSPGKETSTPETTSS